MRRIGAVAVALSAALATTGVPQDAEAQGWKDRVKQRVKQQVEQRGEQRVVEGADKAMNAAENAIKCVVTDKACIAKAQEAGQPVIVTDASGAAVPSADSAAAMQAAAPAAGPAMAKGAPGSGVWVNFDFVPGDRVIFAEDMMADNVGDFPRRLEFKSGNLEIAEMGDGTRLMRATSFSDFIIPLPETLPERFTMEFDFLHNPGWTSYIYFEPEKSDDFSYVELSPRHGGLEGPVDAGSEYPLDYEAYREKRIMMHGRIMVDGRYVKIYINDKRVANVPNATIKRTNQIAVRLPADDDSPAFFGNIRIAAGGKKLYDALNEKGRVTTQGIYFATGSDVVRPESSPTLKEIAKMMADHPDLVLEVEGHTDNVGDDAANQSLSERRAQAVVAVLTGTYQVDAARLTAKGYGESRPVTGNDTPEGRQQNRRVELAKPGAAPGGGAVQPAAKGKAKG